MARVVLLLRIVLVGLVLVASAGIAQAESQVVIWNVRTGAVQQVAPSDFLYSGDMNAKELVVGVDASTLPFVWTSRTGMQALQAPDQADAPSPVRMG